MENVVKKRKTMCCALLLGLEKAVSKEETMLYRVEREIYNDFPDFFRGVVIASNVDNTSHQIPELERMLRTRIAEIETDNTISLEHPRIQAWYKAYQRFGVKRVRKTPPSIAALVRRVKRGKGSSIPFISPLVAISNLISLTYLVPSGGIDAETISGNLVLGKARGNEKFVPLGREEPSPPNPGEVIYYDGGNKNVICRAWNSRAGRSTIISETTRSAVIDVDCILDVISRAEAQEATEQLASLVREFCKGQTRIEYLSIEQPEFPILLSA